MCCCSVVCLFNLQWRCVAVHLCMLVWSRASASCWTCVGLSKVIPPSAHPDFSVKQSANKFIHMLMLWVHPGGSGQSLPACFTGRELLPHCFWKQTVCCRLWMPGLFLVGGWQVCLFCCRLQMWGLFLAGGWQIFLFCCRLQMWGLFLVGRWQIFLLLKYAEISFCSFSAADFFNTKFRPGLRGQLKGNKSECTHVHTCMHTHKHAHTGTHTQITAN